MRFKTNKEQRGQADYRAHYVAKGLGVFSILLGVTELVVADPLSRALGLDGYAWLVRVYGVRELLTGVFIFATQDPTGWIWFRVAGDALDLATVGFGYMRNPLKLANIVISLAALVPVTLIDLYCASRLTGDSKTPQPPVQDYSSRTG